MPTAKSGDLFIPSWMIPVLWGILLTVVTTIVSASSWLSGLNRQIQQIETQTLSIAEKYNNQLESLKASIERLERRMDNLPEKSETQLLGVRIEDHERRLGKLESVRR